MTHKKTNVFLIFLPAIIFLGLWEFGVMGSERLRFLFAAPSLIFQAGLAALSTGTIYKDVFFTLAETIAGLCWGMAAGTIVGLLLSWNSTLNDISRPYIILLGAIPIFALAPVTIMWFGIGFLSKAIMAGFAVFFVALSQAYEGARIANKQYAGFARSLNARPTLMIRKIIVPGALDWVFNGFKMNVGLALTGAFIAEFVSSEAGLGNYILRASSLYDMPKVFFGLLLMSCIAILLTSVAEAAQKKFWPH
ncbi:MAG: ABC transporter permease subunit [Alphaproteobacteria bacterium]|nr:ABC transporter permease subunit [Alphaproteobacteria bacterium]